MLVTSPPELAEFRVQLASAFNPIGSVLGILIGRQFIFSGSEASATQRAAMTAAQLSSYKAAEAQAVQLPYLVISGAVAILAISIAFTRFPPSANERQCGPAFRGLSTLLRSRFFMMGVATQFFYVGVQVGVWSFIIRYAQASIPSLTARDAAVFLTASLGALIAGRFASLPLLRRWSPAKITQAYAVIGAALTLIAAIFPGQIGVYCLVFVSFFMSVMYPAIYTISLSGNMEFAKPGSALVTMAIVGGAVFPALMGFVSDATHSIAVAYLIPTFGFAVVAAYASLAVGRGGKVVNMIGAH